MRNGYFHSSDIFSLVPPTVAVIIISLLKQAIFISAAIYSFMSVPIILMCQLFLICLTTASMNLSTELNGATIISARVS